MSDAACDVNQWTQHSAATGRVQGDADAERKTHLTDTRSMRVSVDAEPRLKMNGIKLVLSSAHNGTKMVYPIHMIEDTEALLQGKNQRSACNEQDGRWARHRKYFNMNRLGPSTRHITGVMCFKCNFFFKINNSKTRSFHALLVHFNTYY